MSPVSFKGKVVLVTGAGSVIGAEVAHHFSKLGATLVLSDTDKIQLNTVNAECGGNCLLIAAELTKNEDVLTVFRQTIEKYKKLDILVNYSGAGEKDDKDVSSLDHYDLTMNVNVRVVYNVTMMAVPHLIKTKGNIVNVSGLSVGRELSHVLSNSVSRSALEQLTKCVALQLASEGVRVNAVSPSMIETTSDAGNLKINGNNKELRSGTSRDVADAVVFLASDCAVFISGANLPVDGGSHLTCHVGDINGNMMLQEDTHTKSEVQSQSHNSGVIKNQTHKVKQVQKQESRGDAVQEQDSKKDHDKREESKEEPSKAIPTKQPTMITMNHDRSSAKKDGDNSQHTKQGNKVETLSTPESVDTDSNKKAAVNRRSTSTSVHFTSNLLILLPDLIPSLL